MKIANYMKQLMYYIFDFFEVNNPMKYASKWLDFIGNLYVNIEDEIYQSEGIYHKNPLTDEQKESFIYQGVPDIFIIDIVCEE